MPGGFDPEEAEDEDKDKDIVDAEAPFHEIGAEILQGRLVSLLIPEKCEKSHGKAHPEKSLINSLPDRDRRSLLAHEPQIKSDCQK